MFDAYSSAIDAGLPPDLAQYANRYVQIESGGNPNARTGSYSGYLQMGPDERARYGGNGLGNGLSMYADNARWFQNKFGRAPNPTELYLTAQQGQGGVAAHLANPDAPAWQNMYSTAEGRKKGEGWAKQAIWGNVPTDMRGMFPGGVDSLTSQQFLDLWQHKVERTPMNEAYADARKSNMTPMQTAMTASDANQYAYSPGYDPNAGLFDRLKAGGPGALFGAPRGVFPGANGQPGYDLGNRLQRAGMWAMAANNPSVLGALGQTAPQRKFVQIGSDEWGNPRYGWVDPTTGSVTSANGAGGAGGAGGAMGGATGSGSGDAITNAIKTGKTGEELLGQPGVPAGVASIVRGISGGAQPYNPSTLMRTPQGRMALALLDQYEPGTTPADYAGRASGMKDWAGGKSNELTRRASQAARHGGELPDTFGEVKGSTSFPALNAVLNFGDQQTGGPAVGRAQQNVTAFANEMGAFVRGNGGSDAAFQEWAKGFPINGSDEQKRAAVGMAAKLFRDSMEELEQKRLRAVGSAQVSKLGSLYSAEAQASLKKMEAYASGGKNSSALPTGVKSIQLIQ